LLHAPAVRQRLRPERIDFEDRRTVLVYAGGARLLRTSRHPAEADQSKSCQRLPFHDGSFRDQPGSTRSWTPLVVATGPSTGASYDPQAWVVDCGAWPEKASGRWEARALHHGPPISGVERPAGSCAGHGVMTPLNLWFASSTSVLWRS